MSYLNFHPLEIAYEYGSGALAAIDQAVCETAPWKLVAITASATALTTLYLVQHGRRRTWDWTATLKWGLRLIPSIDKKIAEETRKFTEGQERKNFAGVCASDVCLELPKNGMEKVAILERLQGICGEMRNGKNTGAIYIDNKDLDELILRVFELALRTNPLHSLSPLLQRLEAEIVRMTCTLFKGDEHTVGNVTTGGTDSIRHAVFTARERAKALGMGAGWELIVPETAHPAFDKAANEYGIKLIRTKVHPQGHSKAYEADLKAMEKAISARTILVAGSAPGFPHGIIDPIEGIAQMLEKKDPKGRIGLHVDGCLGGFVLPFMKDLEEKFGFDVPRVTSISADTHKYGFAEKGTSVVMYRNHDEWRKHQIFVTTDFPGGIYATPTMAGSKQGSSLAATWAAMVYMGASGFEHEVAKIVAATRVIAQKLEQDPDLSAHFTLMGNPKAMVVALCPKDDTKLNIYDIKEEMGKDGWYLTGLQRPAGIHFCVTAVHGADPAFPDEFISALKKALAAVLAYPAEKRGKCGDAQMYGTNQKIGESLFLKDLAIEYWNIAGRAQPTTFALKG